MCTFYLDCPFKDTFLAHLVIVARFTFKSLAISDAFKYAFIYTSQTSIKYMSSGICCICCIRC